MIIYQHSEVEEMLTTYRVNKNGMLKSRFQDRQHICKTQK